MSETSYSADLKFLAGHTTVVELASEGGRVAVAPAFAGRIMTSTIADGDASYGWVNRAFIEAGELDPHFNNYGGEDRIWLGPEAGRFSLWFQPGEPFDLELWKTPTAFGDSKFDVTESSDASVTMSAEFDVVNYAKTKLSCSVKRTISMIARKQASELLGAAIDDGVQMVAFESANTLTNAGDKDWQRQTGLPSIWTLGQFNAQPGCWVMVPFRAGNEAELGTPATTDYFGELPAERYKLGDDRLLFCSDGQCRSKIGISPARVKEVLGSYDPNAGVLTIVQFTLGTDAQNQPYVNSKWENIESLDENYAGDVVNAYSDGPGSGHDTKSIPFYEMETSSPAAELKAGESITHCHRTFHFAGDHAALDALAQKILGISLGEIG